MTFIRSAILSIGLAIFSMFIVSCGGSSSSDNDSNNQSQLTDSFGYVYVLSSLENSQENFEIEEGGAVPESDLIEVLSNGLITLRSKSSEVESIDFTILLLSTLLEMFTN